MLDRGWNTIVCAASGPSLTADQAGVVTAAQTRGRCRVIAVNNTWRMFPNADVLFAADDRWWAEHLGEVEAHGFGGELWTSWEASAARHGIHSVRSMLGDGLPRDPDCIASRPIV